MVRGDMNFLAVVCGDVVSLLVLRDKVPLLRDEAPSLPLVCEDLASLLLVCEDVASLLLVCGDVASGESGIRSVDGRLVLVCFFVCKAGQVCVCRLVCMTDRGSPATTTHKSVPLMIAYKQVPACP